MNSTAPRGPALRPGVLIQMSGAPGAGKSTLARLLRQEIGGTVIDHDIIRSSLLEEDDLSFDQAARKAYRLQWALAKEMMQQGHSVIIDSTCNYQEIIDQGSALAALYSFTYWYVECKVDNIDLLDERLRARLALKSQRTSVETPPEAARDARKDENPRAQFKKWIDAPCRPAYNVITINSADDPNIGRDRVMEHIIATNSADDPNI